MTLLGSRMAQPPVWCGRWQAKTRMISSAVSPTRRFRSIATVALIISSKLNFALQGFNLLFYLETLVGREAFESFAKAYIVKYGSLIHVGSFEPLLIVLWLLMQVQVRHSHFW